MLLSGLRDYLRVVEDISLALARHFGWRLRGLALSGKALTTRREEDLLYLIAVFKGIEKVSFYARGEYTVYFLNKIRKTESYQHYMSKYALEPPLYVLPVDVKELKYGIPFLVDLLIRAVVLYDPDGEVKKAIELFNRRVTKTGFGFSMGITKAGEVKEA